MVQPVLTEKQFSMACRYNSSNDRCKIIHGFTLIELLVVISIISLLVSILLPSLTKARELAKEIKCKTNLKTMSVTTVMYSESNDNFLPPNDTRMTFPQEQSWAYLLQEYWGENTGNSGTSVTTCPSDATTHWTDGYWYGVNYAMNLRLLDQVSASWIAGPTMGSPIQWEKIANPANKILYVDSFKGLTNTSEYYNGIDYRHGGMETDLSANYVFCDGHIATVPEGEISPLSIYYWGVHDPVFFNFSQYYYWNR